MKEFLTYIGIGGATLAAQFAQSIPTDLPQLDAFAKTLTVPVVLCGIIIWLLQERKGTKEEYKQEMAKKDLKIEALEDKLDTAMTLIGDLRRHVLQITPQDVDSSATVRRSTLKLKEQEENA